MKQPTVERVGVTEFQILTDGPAADGTLGRLIFIAATTDNAFRAGDTETGEVLWETKPPAGGQANPITFETGGRQFVAIHAGGHHFMKTPVGDYFIAWALPKGKREEPSQ
jgi:quinoprotein glucose dehydrogenase